MKKYKNDIVLAAAVFLVALIIFLLYIVRANKGGAELEVVADGEIYGTYSLLEDRDVEILTSYGSNRLIIEDGCAYMEYADCPDKICVKQGKISKRGQTIICLPHKLTVRIVKGEEGEVDATVGK